MKAIDSNILVYAHRRESPWHEGAYRVLQELANGSGQWAIPWPCLYEFYAVVTHPRVYTPPSTATEAIVQIEEWLSSPSVVLLAESESTWKSLRALLADSVIAGPRVHDAKIANLCIENGIDELLTADRDFSRFPRLKTRNPLIPR